MGEVTQLVQAEDLLAKMRAGTKEVYEVKIRQLTIPVRMLSLDERTAIRNESIQENARLGGDQTNLSTIMQKKIMLAAASLKNGQPNMLSDRLMSMMTLDEVIFIYNEYIKICEQVNPSLESMDPEVFKELVSAIKKNNVSANDCSLVQLKAVFIAFQDMIQQLDFQTLPTDNLSGGPL